MAKRGRPEPIGQIDLSWLAGLGQLHPKRSVEKSRSVACDLVQFPIRRCRGFSGSRGNSWFGGRLATDCLCVGFGFGILCLARLAACTRKCHLKCQVASSRQGQCRIADLPALGHLYCRIQYSAPVCALLICMFQKQGAWARAAELGVSISGFSVDRARLPELGPEQGEDPTTINCVGQRYCWRPHRGAHRGAHQGVTKDPRCNRTQREILPTIFTNHNTAAKERKCNDHTDHTDHTDHPPDTRPRRIQPPAEHAPQHAARGTEPVSSQRYRCLLTAVPPSSRADSLVSSPGQEMRSRSQK